MIGTGRLGCECCGNDMDPEEYVRLAGGGALVNGAEVGREDLNRPVGERRYTCSSCGGSISVGALSVTGRCPFCGNPIVFMDKYHAQKFAPDYIIPFRIRQETFLARWEREYSKFRFLPDSFRKSLAITTLTPKYVPFWLYDIDAEGSVTCRLEKIHREYGDKKNFYHTIYDCSARGSMSFTRLPQDGSIGMDDDISHALEPYDLQHAKAFNYAYLSGQNAEIFDMNSIFSFRQARLRAEETFVRFLANADDYSYYKVTGKQLKIIPRSAQYALFPIWYMELEWKSDLYRIAMNGSTGKFVCDVPTSLEKLLVFLAGVGLFLWGLALPPAAFFFTLAFKGEDFFGWDLPEFVSKDLGFFCISMVFLLALGVRFVYRWIRNGKLIRLLDTEQKCLMTGFSGMIFAPMSFIACFLLLLRHPGGVVCAGLVIAAVIIALSVDLYRYIVAFNNSLSMKLRHEGDHYVSRGKSRVKERKLAKRDYAVARHSRSIIGGKTSRLDDFMGRSITD